MSLWLWLYLFVPVLVGVFMNEYKNDIFRLIRTATLIDYSKSHYDLMIYIPSSRSNFELRAAIRESWLGHVTKNSSLSSRVHAKFVVGNEPCHVPPQYRLNVFSCDEWLINATGKRNGDIENLTAVEVMPADTELTPRRMYGVQSISFIVNHPVVLTKLGVFKDSIGTRAKVKLLERTTQREIVSAVFTREFHGIEAGGFLYRTVQPYFLPKGFEGTVVGENLASGNGILVFDSMKTNLQSTRNNGSGVIEFLEENILPEGHYYDLRRWKSRAVDIVSFIYNVEELAPLNQLVAEKPGIISAWTNNCSKESEQLREESDAFEDILFVDVVDVYRNVPLKFLHFAQWAVENVRFRYLLKTDDDCFVDVDRVLAKIESLNGVSKTWLGRFRHNWVVERHGKWLEPSYPAIVYPKFACGSGYVLTHDLVKWTADNAHMLKPYQGEDVSMGIWLAAVGPNYVDEPLWQCEKDCLSDMYTEPDLRTDEIHQTWSNLQTCSDPCGCT